MQEVTVSGVQLDNVKAHPNCSSCRADECFPDLIHAVLAQGLGNWPAGIKGYRGCAHGCPGIIGRFQRPLPLVPRPVRRRFASCMSQLNSETDIMPGKAACSGEHSGKSGFTVV